MSGSVRRGVTVASGQAVTGVDLDLDPGGVIAGRVTTAGGVPAPFPTVTAFDATGDGYSVTGDATGRYNLTGLAPGTYTINASADGDLPGFRRRQRLVVNDDSQQPRTTRWPAGSALTGAVSLAAGGPTGGTPVVTAQSVRIRIPRTSATAGTGLNGDSFSNSITCPPGRYNVTVSLDGYVTQTIASVAAAQGSTQDVGTIALEVASSLSGNVVSQDPTAAAAFSIVSLESGTSTIAASVADSSGAFTIDGDLPAGTYTMTQVTTATRNRHSAKHHPQHRPGSHRRYGHDRLASGDLSSASSSRRSNPTSALRGKRCRRQIDRDHQEISSWTRLTLLALQDKRRKTRLSAIGCRTCSSCPPRPARLLQ